MIEAMTSRDTSRELEKRWGHAGYVLRKLPRRTTGIEFCWELLAASDGHVLIQGARELDEWIHPLLL